MWKNKDPQKSGTVIDVKKEWTFINDIRQFGINNMKFTSNNTTYSQIVWIVLSTKVIHTIWIKFHIVDLNDLCDPQSLNHMIVYVYSCHHLPVVNIAVKNAAAT